MILVGFSIRKWKLAFGLLLALKMAGEAARELLPTLSVKVFLLCGIEIVLESCSRIQNTTVEIHMHISSRSS
jgi:hypothetical protein